MTGQAPIQECATGHGGTSAAAPLAAGIFALDPEDAAARAAQGFGFISVGTDIGLLANGGRRLLQTCRG